MNKRQFLKNSILVGASLPFFSSNFSKALADTVDLNANELARNTDFWEAIREDYDLNEEYINLESGYYNIMPISTLKAMAQYAEIVNKDGAFYMRGVQKSNKEKVMEKLAKFLNCSSKNIVLTRNATESLDTVIKGMTWEKGDEAIFAIEDYGAMQDMFQQVAKRYGINLKIISVPKHPKNDSEIINIYKNAVTDKTKLLMVSHMINITGQILPVKEICSMAKARGVKTLIDGAHSVAHFDFNITDFDCDFYGASLHKWLAAPLGTGLLYVADQNIDSLWPLLSNGKRKQDDISDLSHIGTHPVYHDLAIENAIEYCNAIGMKRKEERLRYLQEYWTSKVRNVPNIIVNTPEESGRSCAIANVNIEGVGPNLLAKRLMDNYQIFTVAIDTETVKGTRITPNVFNRVSELDKLVMALKEIARV